MYIKPEVVLVKINFSKKLDFFILYKKVLKKSFLSKTNFQFSDLIAFYTVFICIEKPIKLAIQTHLRKILISKKIFKFQAQHGNASSCQGWNAWFGSVHFGHSKLQIKRGFFLFIFLSFYHYSNIGRNQTNQ